MFSTNISYLTDLPFDEATALPQPLQTRGPACVEFDRMNLGLVPRFPQPELQESQANSTATPLEPCISAIQDAIDAIKSRFLATGAIPVDESNKFSLLTSSGDRTYTETPFPLESADALGPLIASCKEATFGRGNEDVLDPSYRSALVLQADKLALVPPSTIDPYTMGIVASIKETLFTEDQFDGRRIVARLDKLNVYKEGNFFKGHVDTPASKDMFGTLVMNLPSHHVGGQLVIRAPESNSARGEHTCDWGNTTGISWVAFFSDCEHEVLPVTSGYRVTLSYTLSLIGEDVQTEPLRLERLAGAKNIWWEPLAKALEDPAIFNETRARLCFHLEHRYPVDVHKTQASKILPMLKGRDSILYHALKSSGLRVRVHHVLNIDEPAYEYDRVKNPNGGTTVTTRYVRKQEHILLPSKYKRGFDYLPTFEEVSELSALATRLYHAKSTKVLKMMEISQPIWQNSMQYLTYGNQAAAGTTYTGFAIVATAPNHAVF